MHAVTILKPIPIAIAVCVAVLAAASALWPGQALAADKQVFLGQFRDWYAFQLNEAEGRSCYIVSKPERQDKSFPNRGDVVVFVTHRAYEGERDVINFQAGYTYKPKSDVSVTVGDASFSLYTSKDTAWLKTAQEEKSLIQAMVKGVNMVVKGTPARGSTTRDVYSLLGFTDAYKRIGRACNVGS